MTLFDPDSDNLPKLSELEPIPGAPKHAAWFWGKDDELGRLNLLTPRRIAKAAKLIQTGERACLNYPAEHPYPPFFGREPFQHKVKQVTDFAFDDLYNMNTQSGSQWDGFRHVGIAHNGSFVWYNNTTADQIRNSSRIGIQAWAKRGIVGRGVLIDFYSFSQKSYDPFESRKITAEEFKACAKAQNLTFEYGDILIIRTGWSEAYRNLDQKGREDIGSKAYLEHQFAGLSREHEMVELLHDNYFSAVGSDAPTLETWPMDDPDHLHHFLLPLWGAPIGELWDVDLLAELCKKHNRYSFFFTSSPSNVQGGVGTHPNAVAIF
ncbi:hypothetical protein K432DRAFT_347843 [Lepidopterella palustris CBS 459.81]|uniref:Cyclase n=1 Tax=Lepidopterella palustris CBS 459.81 TaxID=1314670 RepID=A0A8E2EFF0_9PEZI|nr:hypothetical protein K432DRAFT_347843 [Lepidopterella palustris CBS 459.81]